MKTSNPPCTPVFFHEGCKPGFNPAGNQTKKKKNCQEGRAYVQFCGHFLSQFCRARYPLLTGLLAVDEIEEIIDTFSGFVPEAFLT